MADYAWRKSPSAFAFNFTHSAHNKSSTTQATVFHQDPEHQSALLSAQKRIKMHLK
jgi:hypothetical protein